MTLKLGFETRHLPRVKEPTLAGAIKERRSPAKRGLAALHVLGLPHPLHRGAQARAGAPVAGFPLAPQFHSLLGTLDVRHRDLRYSPLKAR